MWNGCFDRAYLDFCASRLTDFACVFWTDSRLLGVVNRGKDAHLLDNAIKQLELNGNTLPRVVFDDLLEGEASDILLHLLTIKMSLRMHKNVNHLLQSEYKIL